MAKPNADDTVRYARRDIGCYMMALMPGVRIARVHDFMIGELISAFMGAQDRLMFFVPPGTGKSTLVGIGTPAWYLGKWPDRYVLDITYAQDVANDLGRGVRNLLADPLHRVIFPDSVLSSDSRANHKFSLTAGGRFKAAGIGGPITGRRAHLAIIDDWVKNGLEANSVAEQIKSHEWFKSVVYDRLVNGAIIVISGTRWAHGDLAGRIQEDADDYRVIKIPARAVEGDPMGREPGEWHYPEAYPPEFMLRKERNVGETNWNAKYQQEPVLHDGTLFKRDTFQYGQPDDTISYKVQSWDMASEDNDGADFSAATTWAVAGNRYYLVDAHRVKAKAIDMYSEMAAYAEKHKPAWIIIEDKDAGKSVLQRAQREAKFNVVPYSPGKASKVSRAIDVIDCFEKSEVVFTGKWRDYEEEILSFPFGRHDDWVDSTTQALAYMRSKIGQRFAVHTGGRVLGVTFRNF